MSARNNRLGRVMVSHRKRSTPFFGALKFKVGKRPVKGRAAVKRESHEQAA